MSQDDFSRRDFLLRTGQYGLALSILGPGVGRSLLALPVHAPPVADSVRDQALASAAAEDLSPILSGLSWRMLGPFRGGRVDAVSGVPGRPHEFYFGAVNGGVWKSIDAGRVWTPIFDAVPEASIGALAVAPSAPDVVYVGTGESTLRDSASFGTGMYRSTDAGRTWTHIGLAGTQHIGKIAVDPRDPQTVFVAALGHLYAPNAERGIFRSRDGGRTWTKVLGTDDVGGVEVVIDPKNSRVIYAGLWNTRRPPWFVYRPSNGPGGGIFKSTDGGTTWKRLTHGLPTGAIGRSGIAVAPTNPRRVYAVIDCLDADPHAPAPAAPPDAPPGFTPEQPMQGGFFRSDDGGATWTKLSGDQALWGRGWYFEKIAVDPKNADIVYVPNVAVNRSMDGGKTWVVLRGSPGGDDYHQFWVSPDDPNTAIVASDQGAVVTRNARATDPRQVTWSSWLNQPTAQLYHISVDYRTPYWVTGAQQDSGAVAVRSRGKFAEISMRDWEPIGAGGESGYTAGDRMNPGIIFGGTGERWDLAQNIALPGTSPQMPAGVQPRADWTQPLVFSKADPNALYYADQLLFKTSDRAKTWKQISPDLTYDNPPVPATLDEASANDVEPNRNGRRGVIFTIAPSPLSAPMLWVGTDDGRIWLTTDDGAHWGEVTPPAITPWSRVTMLEASHFDLATAYASVDRHQLQDFEPYVYRTRDNGKTWQKITTGLPSGVYVHTVKEDPTRRGLLFAGTERGAFVSLDDGEHWQSIQMNLPVTSVRDFEIHDDDLVVGTFGRGIYVIDDISALRQVNEQVLASDAYLFKPADTTYYVEGGDNGTPLQKDEPQASNPQNGVAIDYYLKAAASGPVTLEVLDSSGSVLRTFSNGPNASPPAGRRGRARTGGIPNVSPLWQSTPEPFATSAGMHRVVWNPVANDRGSGVFGRQPTPLSGSFTARLTVNGKTYTQGFEVKPDPRVAAEAR